MVEAPTEQLCSFPFPLFLGATTHEDRDESHVLSFGGGDEVETGALGESRLEPVQSPETPHQTVGRVQGELTAAKGPYAGG